MAICITCPVDCSAIIPVCSFTDCNPVTHRGQVTDVLIGKVGHPMVDWTDAAEWTTRISCSDIVSANAIRHWFVTGAYNKPETTQNKLAHGIVKAGDRTFKMTVFIDQMNQANRDLIRALECGGKLLMWFVIGGEVMFGGDEGIEISADGAITAADNTEELMKGEIDITWKSKCSPLTADNIIPNTYQVVAAP